MSELDYWAGRFFKGQISRREFIGRAGALGATALTSNLVAKIANAAEPKKGGFARFAMAAGATTDTMDPGTWPDTFTQCAFYGAMCNNLTEIDASGKVVPDLAESFEPDATAKKWVFKLRKGVTFHNGKDVTATDVVETFKYHMAPNSKSAAKSLLASVTNVTSDGPNTVIFELTGGNADFPALVSDYHLPIMPAKDGGGMDWAKGVGSGAFSLENFNPGVSAKFKRNPNYHKNNLPYFDEVEFLSVPDVSARTNALTTGEVNFMAGCDLKTLNLLKRNTKINILEVEGIGHYTFAMNTQVAPFNNPDARRALKYAIDREEIVKKVFLGHAKAGNDNPIASSIQYATDPQPKYTYDADKAKFYLKKAGLDSLTIDLSVAEAAFPGATDSAVLYSAQAAKAGINIKVDREPNDGYWDNVWMKKPMVAVYWSGRVTCDWMFTSTYADGAAWNDTNWKNARFNELLLAARSELDNSKRAGMYAEMQQIVHDDGGTIVLVFNNYVNATSKNMQHGDLVKTWDMDGFKMAERWWFA
jgi:peptide/nickel transport system substrate-binding protein